MNTTLAIVAAMKPVLRVSVYPPVVSTLEHARSAPALDFHTGSRAV
jgi:hypothetical protein